MADSLSPPPADIPGPAGHRPRGWGPPLGLGIVGFGFYLFTLAPGTLFGDGPQFQTAAWTGEFSSAAYAHPAYTLLGRLFVALPVGTVAWRVNVMTALWAAVTLGVIAAATPRLLRAFPCNAMLTRWSTVVATGLLAVNHTFWSHATSAEVYSLSTVFLAGALWCAAAFEETGRVRYAAGLVAILCAGGAHHLQVPFFLLWWGPWLLWRLRARGLLHARALGALALGALIGSVPFTIIFLYDLTQQVRIGRFAVYFALGGPFLGNMGGQGLDWVWALKNTAINVVWDLTPWGAVAVAVGGVAAWRGDRVLFGWLVPAACLTGLHAATYNVGDQYAFFQPLWLVVTPLMALGLRRWGTRWGEGGLSRSGLLMLAVPVVVNWSLPRPDSRETWYAMRSRWPGISHPVMTPNRRGQTWSDAWAGSVFAGAAPHARVIAYWWADFHGHEVLQHHQRVYGTRPDITLSAFMGAMDRPIDFASLLDAEIDHRPIYLTTYNPVAYGLRRLKERFTFMQEGSLIRVGRRADVPRRVRAGPVACAGVWSGRTEHTGYPLTLTIHHWPDGLAGWLAVEIPGHLRIETPVSSLDWDGAAQRLSVEIADVAGRPLRLSGEVRGDQVAGVWRFGADNPVSGRWRAGRRATTGDFSDSL